MATRYKIVRYYQKHGRRTVRRNVSLEEAQRHCRNTETSSTTATSSSARRRTRKYGPWFDGYTTM